MNEKPQTCNSFNPRTSENAAGLPPLLGRLLDGMTVYSHLRGADLREMSKFGEIPNLAGLAAHPIRRPAPAGLDLARPAGGTGPPAIAGEPNLPGGARKALQRELAQNPCLLVHGRLAGAGGAPLGVRVIIPQKYAHLAAAVKKMLWPLEEMWHGHLARDQAAPDNEKAHYHGQDARATNIAVHSSLHYSLFFWPEPLVRRSGQIIVEDFVGHWPAEGLGIVIGFDDPGLLAAMLLDAARRFWEEKAHAAQADCRPRLLPAGWGVATVEPESGAARLKKLDPAKYKNPAAGEPLLIENVEQEQWLTPVWLNPLLPAGLLALGGEAWRAAALTSGALPLGVRVDDEGWFPLFDQSAANSAEEVAGKSREQDGAENGWMIVPRAAIPKPYLNEAKRYGVASC